MRSPSWRLTLRVIAVLSFIVAIVWVIVDPGFQPLLAFLFGISSLLASFKTSDEPITEILSKRQRASQQERNRESLLQKVKSFWIQGVLEQSLHGKMQLELDMEYRPDMVLQRPNRPNRKLRSGTRILEVFEEVGGELLILGEPGSGKTTMLLELASDLITRAERDDDRPMPVVFNLSSWAEEREPLADWIVDELNVNYGASKRIGKAWVDGEQVLPLLDGLDEVRQEHREACVEAINRFREEHGLAAIVICSRTAEYEALSARLKLQDAIVLQPLEPEHIDSYLAKAGDKLAIMGSALSVDAELRKLVQTPLMFNIMILVYQGAPAADIPALGPVQERRKYLFDAYVDRMFARIARAGPEPYSKEKTVRWLAWLAQRMSVHSQTVFLIERMQPSWLQREWGYRVLVGLAGGLAVGLLFGLPVGLVFGLLFGLLLGLAVGLVIGLVIGLSDIEPAETLSWSWAEARAHWRWVPATGLATGLASGLATGLVAGLPTVLVFGLAGGLVTGLVFGLVGGLVGGLVFGLVRGLATGLVFGLSVWLVFGGSAFIQHFVLRFILWRRQRIPWQLARFLDYAAERIILRKVGGGYIFIHRLLLDYFASLETEQRAKKR